MKIHLDDTIAKCDKNKRKQKASTEELTVLVLFRK